MPVKPTRNTATTAHTTNVPSPAVGSCTRTTYAVTVFFPTVTCSVDLMSTVRPTAGAGSGVAASRAGTVSLGAAAADGGSVGAAAAAVPAPAPAPDPAPAAEDGGGGGGARCAVGLGARAGDGDGALETTAGVGTPAAAGAVGATNGWGKPGACPLGTMAMSAGCEKPVVANIAPGSSMAQT